MQKNNNKIFIGWSKSKSNKIASLIHDFIKSLSNDFIFFYSKANLDDGEVQKELLKEIPQCYKAYFIITPEFIEEQVFPNWELGVFERSGKDKCVPILFNVKKKQLNELFLKYKHIKFTKATFKNQILKTYLEIKLGDEIGIKNIEKKFDENWNELKSKVDEILKQRPSTTKSLKDKLISSLCDTYINNPNFNTINIVANSADGNLPTLPINKYFVQLSYIEIKELKNRDSIIAKEYKGIETKSYRRNFVPDKYLSKTLLQDYDRIIIIGNPGVGKSTFAKWYCHTCASNKSTAVYPIFISLRNINFNIQLPLIDYIKKNYLKEYKGNDIDIKTLLLKHSNQFCLLLDGFDELSHHKQIALKQEVETTLPTNGKYILLTRPYGLLNTQNWNQNFTLNIDGLAENNVTNYIQSVIKISKVKGKKSDQLLQIIKDNKVLKDYEHIPLMLSFIVYVYLYSSESENVLQKIQSKYELQKLVIHWMNKYEQSKQPLNITYEDFLAQIGEIAYSMLLSNSFTVQVNANNRKSLLALAEFGIGTIHDFSDSISHFSFLSITFQEYFAAEHIKDKVNSKYFLCIIENRVLWNFAQMIFGALSNERQYELITKLLSALYDKGKIDYYHYLRILLLSETSTEYIHSNLKESDIKDLFTYFSLGVYNAKIEEVLPGAFINLYKKFNHSQKTFLRKKILFELSNFAKKSIKEKDYENSIGHQYNVLMLFDDFKNDFNLLDGILSILSNLLTKNSKTKNVNDLEVLIWQYIEKLFLFDASLFMSQQIKKVCQNLILPFIQSKYFYQHTYLQSFYVDIHKELKSLISLIANLKITNIAYEKAKEKTLIKITKQIYACGNRFAELTDSEKELYKNIILDNQNELLKLLRCQTKDLDSTGSSTLENYIYLLFSGLNETNCTVFYEFMLNIISIDDSDLIDLSDINFNNDEAFFQLLLKKYIIPLQKGSKNYNLIDNFFKIIGNSKNIKYQFQKIRFKVSTLITNYVNTNKIAFQNVSAYEIRTTDTRVSYYSVTKVLDNLIDRTYNVGLFEFDKKFIIDEILKLNIREYKYFKENFLPSLLHRDFQLYQQSHKEFLLTYLVKKEEYKYLVSVLRNKSIYNYKTNLSFLEEFISYTASNLNEEFVFREINKLLEICANTLILIKELKEQNINIILINIREILLHKSLISNLKSTDSIYNIDGDSFAAYCFLYHFIKDKKLILKIDFYKKIKQSAEQMSFFNTVIDFFSSNGKLIKKELNDALPPLGITFKATKNRFSEYNENLDNQLSLTDCTKFLTN